MKKTVNGKEKGNRQSPSITAYKVFPMKTKALRSIIDKGHLQHKLMFYFNISIDFVY